MDMRRLAMCVLAICLFWQAIPPMQAAAVSAVSAVVFEPTSGTVLFEKDAHTPRAMASTTKLMTALLAADVGDWEREVTVTAEMTAVEGSSLGLRPGDRLTLRDTVCGMLLASGNDAANAVALTLAGSLPAFAEMMNTKAAALGMADSHFVTPSGLDAEGHAASAYDMALLGAAVLKDDTLRSICAMKSATLSVGDRRITVTNHNRLLSLFPDAIGLKTGFTKKSGRCLVSAAERDGVTLVAVTLNDGNDWNDHIAMLEEGFSRVKAVELPRPVLPDLPVAGGTEAAVPLMCEAPAPLVLPAGQEGRVSMTLCLPRFVLAPVAAGDPVGEAIYTLDGEVLCRCPVTVQKAVAARPVADRGTRFLEYVRLLWRALIYT